MKAFEQKVMVLRCKFKQAILFARSINILAVDKHYLLNINVQQLTGVHSDWHHSSMHILNFDPWEPQNFVNNRNLLRNAAANMLKYVNMVATCLIKMHS